MSSVAVLTFHFVPNYGAALQTYALQTAINRIGHKCYIADYRSAYIERGNAPAAFGLAPKTFAKYLLMSRYQKRRMEAFLNFQNSELTLTKSLSADFSGLRDYGIKSIVVGSDQVWNPAISGNDTAYLLVNADCDVRKVSYAASLGSSSFPGEFETEWLRGVMNFDYVSVRESSAKLYLENHLNMPVAHVADPVILLSSREWEEQIPHQDALPTRYVLLYCLNNVNRKMLSFARSRCRQLGARLVVIHYSPAHVANAYNVRDCSPLEFVSYIANAAEVVTSSFHGACFSLLFHKPFYSLHDATANRTEARVKDLLRYCGVEGRYVASAHEALPISNQDWMLVDHRLEELRQESIDYLTTALDDND